MKPDVIHLLETLMDYCNDRWLEADKAPAGAFPTADMLTGKKMAYNDLLQFVRKQLAERSGQP